MSSTTIGAAGVFYVCAELTRQGHTVVPTPDGTPGFDILAASADANRQVAIQVKASAKYPHHHWPVGKKAETLVSPTLFYVFVDMPPDGSAPRFHIVPSAVVADYAHRDHASRAPHSPGAEKMRNFSDKENAYLGRWDLLGLAGKE